MSRGAEQDGLLAAYVADAQATAAAKGPQSSPRDVDIAGRPAVEFPRLDTAGLTWDVVAFQVADAIVEMPMGNTNTLAVSAVLSSGVPGNSQSGVGPDSIAGLSYNGDGASPAVMTYDLLDTLGIGPWDVCRVDFQDGENTGRLWRLGKGGAATLAVTRPEGTLTWYYGPAGKGFVEFQTKHEAQALLPQLPKASKR